MKISQLRKIVGKIEKRTKKNKTNQQQEQQI